jgi:hypothetical protein
MTILANTVLQLFGQRFMRQVPYQRPKEFFDPYLPSPSMPVVNERYMLLQRRKKANSSAQVHRIQRLSALDGDNSRRDLRQVGQPLCSAPSESWAWADEFEEDNGDSAIAKSDVEASITKTGLDLGGSERMIKVFDSTFSKGRSDPVYEVSARISKSKQLIT